MILVDIISLEKLLWLNIAIPNGHRPYKRINKNIFGLFEDTICNDDLL